MRAPAASIPAEAVIREVGPRDGLQNEDPVPVEARVRLIDALSRTGLRHIEVGAFVHPAAIPPMAASEEVFARIERVPGVLYTALVPNVRGVERAITVGADEVEVVVSASTTHNEHNVKRSTEESMRAVPELVALARDAGIPAQGVVATSFGCPYEGDVDPARVADLVSRYLDAGCDSVCLGDTTGMATPTRVWDVLGRLPECDLTLHLHNTRGTGLANVLAGLEAGVTSFDASVGGMGGCPYAPGASGNIVTEDLVHMLADMGVTTGIDLDALVACAAMAEDIVGHELPSQVLRAGPRVPA